MDERRIIASNLFDQLSDQAKDIALNFLRAGVRFEKSGNERDLNPGGGMQVKRGLVAQGPRGVVMEGDRITRTTSDETKDEMLKVIDEGQVVLAVLVMPTGEMAIQVFQPPTPEFCQGLISLIEKLPTASAVAESGVGPQ